MKKIFILTFSMLYTCFSLANSSYQIDLILFTHQQSAGKNSEVAFNSPLIPVAKSAIPLKTDSSKSAKVYRLLSPSKSGLRNEYYLLNRKPQFHILGHYSWIQPGNNQKTVALPTIDRNGWQLQGTVQVKQSNYYLLNTDLQLSPPNAPQSSYTVSQKQRLKGGVVYYLDHPQLGMLIKIHKLGSRA